MTKEQAGGSRADRLIAPIEAMLRPAVPGQDHFLIRVLGQFGTLASCSTLISLAGAVFHVEAATIATITVIILLALYIIIYREQIDRSVRPSLVLMGLFAALVATVLAWQFVPRDNPGAGLSKATGIIKYTPHANDFLPELQNYIAGAKDEIWLTGISFYLTLPQHKEHLLEALRRGVDVRILIYDPLSPNLSEVAAGFSQTPQQLAAESDVTISNLQEIYQAWKSHPTSAARFEVRLFQAPPRARLYIFDRRNEDGFTYFIPHVDDQNTPNLPGFLIRNVRTGIGPAYFEGIDRVWRRSTPFEEFLPRYEQARGMKPAAAPVAH